MKSHRVGVGLLACAAIALSLAGGAWAADIAKLTEACATCHGKEGASTESDVPIIGGMSPTYLEINIGVYKKRERPCPETKVRSGPDKGKKTTMCDIAKELSDSDISQLAKFYAGKKFVRAVQSFDPELAKRGKVIHQDNCEKCHANDGSDVKDDAGMLAGQWMTYLKQSFDEYAAGKRHMEQKMKPKIQKLDKAGFDALANYYASFK